MKGIMSPCQRWMMPEKAERPPVAEPLRAIRDLLSLMNPPGDCEEPFFFARPMDSGARIGYTVREESVRERREEP